MRPPQLQAKQEDIIKDKSDIYLQFSIYRKRTPININLPRVVSGFKPVIFRATSIGSTFARLQPQRNVNITILTIQKESVFFALN